MEFLSSAGALCGFVRDTITPALMLLTGGFFSIRTGFFQIRSFGRCLKSTVFSAVRSKDKSSADNGSVTQFQAMCSALAATLGTGNIAGVATALTLGGAGAVFWMWVSALLGMMTGFAENVLGILYRKRGEDGRYRGGAMMYIRHGLAESRLTRRAALPLSVAFALLCALSGFGMGNMAQMNSAAEAMKRGFSLPPIVTGVVLSAAAAVITFGGVKRIAGFAAKLVPLMSGFYIIGCLYIIIANAETLPRVLKSIIEGAFGLGAAGGGVLGYGVKRAVSTGIRRGAFSNEAGLGTSVAAHAASDVKEPVVQGMWSVFEVFFDTIVVCSMTAFALLSSGCSAPTLDEALNNVSEDAVYCRLSGDNGVIASAEPTLPSTSVTVRTVYGDSFTAELPELSGCSNIVMMRGVSSGHGGIDNIAIEPVDGAALCTYAFSSTFGGAAGKLLAVAVTLFAFTSVLGWSGFGADAAAFLYDTLAPKPSPKGRALAERAYKAVFVLFAVAGACVDMAAAWSVSDTLNALMALPNLFAVLCLSGKVIGAANDFAAQKTEDKRCLTN